MAIIPPAPADLGAWLSSLPAIDVVRPVVRMPTTTRTPAQRPTYRRQRPPGEPVAAAPQQEIFSLVREGGVLRWRTGAASTMGPRQRAGGRAALPMWIDYMRVVLEGVPENPLVPPPGIVTAHINRDTGKPVAPSDPNAMLEYFIEGTVESSTDVLEGGTAPAPEGVREGLF